MPVARLLDLERPEVASFCRRWKVRELAAFGSVLREDFRPESDVDLLVTFEPDANWGLLDQATMENELAELLGRKVDLVSRRAVEATLLDIPARGQARHRVSGTSRQDRVPERSQDAGRRPARAAGPR